jgi:Ser/Thr protein kinase RdoA (MazF antagonist)
VQVVSPYDKDVLHELSSVYGLESIEALEQLVLSKLECDYGLMGRIERVHVAFGLSVMVRAKEIYHLKFWSTANQPYLHEVFGMLEALREADVPAPQVIRRLDGAHFANWLEHSVYDATYLMQNSPGQPMNHVSQVRLESLAKALADWHRVGASFAQGQIVNVRFEMSQGLENILGRLDEEDIAVHAGTWLRSNLNECPGLPTIRTHGDFRLCHVFFEGDSVSGVIDADTSVIRSKLSDLAQAAVSHPNPARCGFLNAEDIEFLRSEYEKYAPLTIDEARAWPIILVYTALEQWAESNRQDDKAMRVLMTELLQRASQDKTMR